MTKFSVNTTNKIDAMIEVCCKATGRTRSGLCLQWIQEGVIKSLEEYKRAGLISDNWAEAINDSDKKPDPEEEDNDE